MPKAPRGKRVIDPITTSFRVVNRAPNGQAEPYFDKPRGVWVAPWRKPDGKVGRPTGKTRVLAVASRDRHIGNVADDARFASLDAGFTADSTVAELATWWLQHVARHRVRDTTFATLRWRSCGWAVSSCTPRSVSDGLTTRRRARRSLRAGSRHGRCGVLFLRSDATRSSGARTPCPGVR